MSFNKFWYMAHAHEKHNKITAKKNPIINGRVNCPKPRANISQVLLAAGHTNSAFGAFSALNTIGVVGDKFISKTVIKTIDVNSIIANNIVGFIDNPPVLGLLYHK